MLTKLQAVNRMLEAIGEDRVSSLSSGVPEAETAEAKLDDVTHDVLSEGWHVNTDENYTVSRDENGRIPIPANVLRIDPAGTDALSNAVPRRRAEDELLYLYDKDELTFSWSKNLKCDIVWLYDFADLTPMLQAYIATRAAVEFQQDELSSVALDKQLYARLLEARTRALDEDAERADANILNDSRHARDIARRNSVYSGT